MIRVKFVKAHPSFGYFAGDIGKVTEERAKMLLDGGYAMPIPHEYEKDPNPLPEDMPARDLLFDAGYKTAEAVKEAGDLVIDIDGIGKGTLKKIKEYLGITEEPDTSGGSDSGSSDDNSSNTGTE